MTEFFTTHTGQQLAYSFTNGVGPTVSGFVRYGRLKGNISRKLGTKKKKVFFKI